MFKKKRLKSEKIRKKNDLLRLKGKDPSKKHGKKLIDSNFGGGANLGSPSGNPMSFERMGTLIEDQKNKSKKS